LFSEKKDKNHDEFPTLEREWLKKGEEVKGHEAFCKDR